MNFLNPLRIWFKQNWVWLRWVLVVAVLVLLFRQYWEDVQECEWSKIHYGMMSLGLICCLASLVLTFFRWYLLVWAQEIPFTVRDSMRLGFIGYFFNYVAPGAVGGDLFKASMIACEQTERRFVAVATVFLDRVVGLMGLLILGAIAMWWQPSPFEQTEFQFVIGIFQLGSLVSLLGFLVLLLPGLSRMKWLDRIVSVPKIGPLLCELINSIRLYQTRWRVLVLSLLLSLISHAGLIFSIYLCALSLHGADEIPSWMTHLQIVPPAELVGVLVPLPGGTGALEEAVAQFYAIAGAPAGHGFLTAFVYRIVTILIALLGGILGGGIWYLTARREIDVAIPDPPPADEMNDEPTGSPLVPLEAVPQPNGTALETTD